jgi:hypothetical protein
MVGPFGQKHRLDAAFEKFVVEFRRRLRRGHWAGTGEHREGRHAYQSTTRHSTLHPRLPGDPNLDRTSNADFDKLDLALDGIQRSDDTSPRPRRLQIINGKTTVQCCHRNCAIANSPGCKIINGPMASA